MAQSAYATFVRSTFARSFLIGPTILAKRSHLAITTSALQSRHTLSILKPNSSARRKSTLSVQKSVPPHGCQQENVSLLAENRSLSALPTWDKSPGSLGVWSSEGYELMITAGTPLPCQETAIFASNADDIETDIIKIFYCPAFRKRP